MFQMKRRRGGYVVVVIQSLARIALRRRGILTAEVLLPDPLERRAELLNAESVNDRVDGGVAVREQDGDVNEKHGLLTLWAEECNTIHDVERQPADREQKQH